jgi:hypothetical protein
MMIVDVLLLVLALFAAAPMIYGIWAGRQRANGIDVPTFGQRVHGAWTAIEPYVLALRWIGGKVFAPKRVTTPPPWIVSSVSDIDYGELPMGHEPETAKDPGLSAGLSALEGDRRRAVEHIMLNTSMDKDARRMVANRANLVAALVSLGWQTGEIRVIVKGDTEAIGMECQAAQTRLGMREPRRVVTVKDGANIRRVEI